MDKTVTAPFLQQICTTEFLITLESVTLQVYAVAFPTRRNVILMCVQQSASNSGFKNSHEQTAFGGQNRLKSAHGRTQQHVSGCLYSPPFVIFVQDVLLLLTLTAELIRESAAAAAAGETIRTTDGHVPAPQSRTQLAMAMSVIQGIVSRGKLHWGISKKLRKAHDEK